jgi:hypothetical protein
VELVAGEGNDVHTYRFEIKPNAANSLCYVGVDQHVGPHKPCSRDQVLHRLYNTRLAVCPLNAKDDAAARPAGKKVRKLLFCTGKVYYDLDKARADAGATDVAIARIEQVAPFPFDLVAAEVAKFPNAKVVFAQEEPRNMGFWTYVAPRIATATRVLNGKEVYPEYVGRLAAASPARRPLGEPCGRIAERRSSRCRGRAKSGPQPTNERCLRH